MNWYSANTRRSYPFKPYSVPVNSQAFIRSLVVDARCWARTVPGINIANTSVRLASIAQPTAGNYTASVVFQGFDNNPGTSVVVSASVSPDTSQPWIEINGSTADYSFRLVVRNDNQGLAITQTWSGGSGIAVFDSARTMIGCRVTSVTAVNRTASRIGSPSAGGSLCAPVVFPVVPGWYAGMSVVPISTGNVEFAAGANATLGAPGRLLLGAAAGAGTGKPCNPPLRHHGDEPPIGKLTNDGGTPCTVAVQSINGIAGPSIQLFSDIGVQITSDPLSPGIRITVGNWAVANCPGVTGG